MTDNIKQRAAVDALREMLWLWPALSVAVSFAAGYWLSSVRWDGGALQGLLFTGDADAARGVLQVVIGTTLTVTATVFSIMVVALQLASTQFSPRSLRSYVRDRGTQGALAVLMAVVSYGVAVLLRSGDGGESPGLAVSIAVLALVPVMAALVYFIHHIAQSIRIEQLMRSITADTASAIVRNHRLLEDPADDGGAGDAASVEDSTLPPAPQEAVGLPASSSGYLQEVDAEGLAELARAHGLTIQLRQVVGQHCVEGVPVAWAWRAGGGPPDPATCRRAAEALPGTVHIGFERTMTQDAAFGLRQLVDISLRAMSPGINDPRTAIEATMQLGQLLRLLADRELCPQVQCDPDGTPRALLPAPSFSAYLALACDELRRFGSGEPTVLTAQLRMLEQVALVTSSPGRRAAIDGQVDVIVAAAERDTAEPADLQQVHRQADAVREALAGRVPGQPQTRAR